MKTPAGTVGPRGIGLLAATGIVGVVLAVHGWSQHSAGGPFGALNASSTGTHQPAGTATSGSAPAASASATFGPSTSAATAGPKVRSTAPASSPGPLLKSQPFAPYAFRIWPGTPSSAAQAALTGLSISVHRQATGLSVSAAVNGQTAGAARFYTGGAGVYVVEASMGDDSGNSDYNLGDDGIVVTDAQGRLVS
jgi:hypothetical protein